MVEQWLRLPRVRLAQLRGMYSRTMEEISVTVAADWEGSVFVS